MSKILQNFYKATITLDWTIGTGNFYVSAKPTPTSGWLVISPNNAASREIVTYTNTGTDVNGDYVTVSARGVGGTTEQTHTIGESIRMNVTAEYWADMQNDIDNIVAAGVSDATTTSMGGVELATSAELIAGTDVSGAGHPLVAQPSIINARISALSNSVIPTTTVFTASGTWTKPAGLKYAVVKVQGAGGGGGASDNTNSRAGAGGGGGGYSEKTIVAASLGATETVTVGTGGAGGVAAAGTGTTGSSSSFGTHATATGGGGGTAGGNGVGGVGGVGSSGDINTTGGAGVMGNNATDSSGAGGSSMLGGGGKGVSGTAVGNTGGVYGGGGSGGSRSSSNASGGDGAAGVVIVISYF